VRAEIEEKIEGSRLKGEVTLIIAPGEDLDAEVSRIAKGSGFDPTKDAHV